MKGISRVIAQPKPATIMMVIMVMEVVEEEDDEVEVEVEVEAAVEVDVEDDKVDAVVVEAIVIMVTEAEVAATSALLGNLTAIKPKPILAEISVVSAEIRDIDGRPLYANPTKKSKGMHCNRCGRGNHWTEGCFANFTVDGKELTDQKAQDKKARQTHRNTQNNTNNGTTNPNVPTGTPMNFFISVPETAVTTAATNTKNTANSQRPQRGRHVQMFLRGSQPRTT